MTKYRLKKWYPSLSKHFKEGMKVEGTFSGGVDYQSAEKIPGGLSLPKEEVENNPKFWEEVCDNCGKPIKEGEEITWKNDCHCKEQDYEILSFKNKCASKANYKLNSEGLYVYSGYLPFNTEPSETSLEKMLEYEKIEIYSVKRLSDGEVFTVGDKTDWGEIKEFSIKGERIFAVTRNTTNSGVYLKELEHKEPLFTTEDGVDIYEGDWFYIINTQTYNWSRCQAVRSDKDNMFKGYKVFSTENKVKECVDKNKPRYSKKDIIEAMKDAHVTGNYFHEKKLIQKLGL